MYKYLFPVLIVSLSRLVSAESIQDSSVTLISQSDTTVPVSEDSILAGSNDSSNVSTNNVIDHLLELVAKKSQTDDELEDLEDQIDDEIDILEDKIDELEDRINELKNAKSDRPDDTIDAEFVINKIKKHSQVFTEGVSKSRAQGYGGGAIIQPMLFALKMKPINELVQYNSILGEFNFTEIDNGYRLMMVTGGLGYGGVGNGMRIGFGGWGGDFNEEGERKSGVRDSVMTLKIHAGFGGMLVEKAIVHKNLNIIIGGMLGGGRLTVEKKMQSAYAYRHIWDNFDEETDKARAGLVGIETHGGFTVTILPWVHLGMDLNALFAFSVNGFSGTGSSGFLTANPGVRMRIVLGNLG